MADKSKPVASPKVAFFDLSVPETPMTHDDMVLAIKTFYDKQFVASRPKLAGAGVSAADYSQGLVSSLLINDISEAAAMKSSEAYEDFGRALQKADVIVLRVDLHNPKWDEGRYDMMKQAYYNVFHHQPGVNIPSPEEPSGWAKLLVEEMKQVNPNATIIVMADKKRAGVKDDKKASVFQVSDFLGALEQMVNKLGAKYAENELGGQGSERSLN